MNDFGKIIILIGLILIFIGLFMMMFSKIPFFGKLPGDILIKRDNFTFYFPVVTSILISIIITIILNFFMRK